MKKENVHSLNNGDLLDKMLRYEEITVNNLIQATKIQNEIFPEESAYEHYKTTIILEKDYKKYYLVYDKDKIIGITGLYSNEDLEETNTIWLGWFGVLEKYRSKGYGKQILLDTIDLAKKLKEKYPIKYLRLYTSEELDKIALPLYNKVMDIKEYYNNKDDFNYNNTCLIYTKKLDNELELWNDKFLNLKYITEREKDILEDTINNKVINYTDILIDKNIKELYKSIDKINPYPYNHGYKHAINVCENVELLCDLLNIKGLEQEALLIAAALHDIGQLPDRANHGEKASIYSSLYLYPYKDYLKDYYDKIIHSIKVHSDIKDMESYELFDNIICLADKLDFTRIRLEEDRRNIIYNDILKYELNIKDNKLIFNVISNEKVTYKNLLEQGNFYREKVLLQLNNFSNKLNLELIIKFNNNEIK